MSSSLASDPLTPAERSSLAALRDVGSLAELADRLGTDDEHAAYVEAKRAWRTLRGKELAAAPPAEGLPGARVVVDGTPFHVHGVTHADTAAERAFLRDHVSGFLDDGAAVYCEQGVRSMYFDDLDAVCEMDDYRWAMARLRDLDFDSGVGFSAAGVDELVEDATSLASEVRETAFSLIEANATVYGEGVADALGDVASAVFTSHANLGTATEYASFAASKRAAEDPARLADLQRHYERSLLPPPIEREWLRRHDPELEVVTHARNERMADYAVHHGDAPAVHLVVGAGHQPGIRYYLERYRKGERRTGAFEPIP